MQLGFTKREMLFFSLLEECSKHFGSVVVGVKPVQRNQCFVKKKFTRKAFFFGKERKPFKVGIPCPKLPYEAMDSHTLLYDLLYNPDETLFMTKGREQGAVVKNGLEMLLLQAFASWEFWNGDEQR